MPAAERQRRPRPGRVIAALAAAGLALAPLGCASTDLTTVYAPHDRGNFQAAADATRQFEPSDSSLSFAGVNRWDELWVLLERGKALQDAGRFAESARVLTRADEIIAAAAFRPSADLQDAGNSAQALLSDERARDYEPGLHEAILVATAQAVNHAMLGDLDTAAVYARRQLDRQEEQRLRSRRLREAYSRAVAGENAGDQRSAAWAQLDREPAYAQARRKWDAAAPDPGAATLIPYGYFVGWVVMNAAGYPAEAEDFARLLRTYATGDTAARVLTGLGPGAPRPDRTVVVLAELGRAPARQPVEASVGGGGGLVALPELAERTRGRPEGLVVRAGAASAASAVVGSVDDAAFADFSSRLGEIWGRPIVSTLIKVGIGVGTAVAIEAGSDDDGSADGRRAAQALAVAAALLWASAAEADLRSWRTLPAEQHGAVLEVPDDATTLRLEVLGRGGVVTFASELPIPAEGPVLVLARSTGQDNLAAYAVSIDPTAAARRARGTAGVAE